MITPTSLIFPVWLGENYLLASLMIKRFLGLSNSTDRFWFWRQLKSFKNSRGRFKALEYLPEVDSLRTTWAAIRIY
ncbi:hypothetical protein COV53_03945 [Candidatus Gottesmanbacteria bacterium CG11_big_fil_rev_8_21_14_0_20_37_11]|uniref:Uncharacterized protein n=1 Tax=Candidatus Gottesmanbacteria bacterium CG11_big_fil_rev_8_21_14_0_20_37_11 TaxID=1974575 RepID=A0A2H0NHA2_9BACT|nr:MAG: hypothetical protein COV53_03945 [Candidatus Gottesmanbacteria bacterium CG11_big_fil_rev_8_21_14_0_20_37_11]